METLLEQQYALPVLSSGLTKTQIHGLAFNCVEGVSETGNALQIAEALSAMDEFVKSVRKDDKFIDAVVSELEKSSGKLTMASGAKIERAETGTTYDFTHDEQWKQLTAQLEDIKLLVKNRETYLKSIAAGKLLTDSETGEVLGVGAAKSSKTNYRITLKS